MANSTRNTKRAPLSDAEREARREAERQLLTDAVATLKASDGWLTWLRVRKHFRQRSINNQLLIALQCPHATRVAGFQAWIKLGYCVRKGEKAIKIFAPVPPSKQKLEAWKATGADPRSRPRTLFRLASVFDVSQVDPLPAPAVPAELTGPPMAKLHGDELVNLFYGPFQALADELGLELELTDRDRPGEIAGWYRPKTRTLCVYTDAPPNDCAATAVHEFAHALLRLDRRDEDPVLDYAAEELVVESVAYSVMASLGVDAGAATIPYLAGWSQQTPIEAIQAHAKLIDRLATRIEEHLTADTDPRTAEAAGPTSSPADGEVKRQVVAA